MAPPELRTPRLVLRRWVDADAAAFAAMNADPDVMEFFPSTLSTEQSDALLARIEAHLDEHGWGLWATEVRESGEFAGFVGLAPVSFEARFTPAVEIGWRLGKRFWGRGLAPEGALAVMRDGFDRVGLDEIVSFTAAINRRSRRVMEKIGMTRDPADDFDHPAIPPGDPLRRHVLYRRSVADWRRIELSLGGDPTR